MKYLKEREKKKKKLIESHIENNKKKNLNLIEMIV
jgi:hypothetical protein